MKSSIKHARHGQGAVPRGPQRHPTRPRFFSRAGSIGSLHGRVDVLFHSARCDGVLIIAMMGHYTIFWFICLSLYICTYVYIYVCIYILNSVKTLQIWRLNMIWITHVVLVGSLWFPGCMLVNIFMIIPGGSWLLQPPVGGHATVTGGVLIGSNMLRHACHPNTA